MSQVAVGITVVFLLLLFKWQFGGLLVGSFTANSPLYDVLWAELSISCLENGGKREIREFCYLFLFVP